MDVVLEGFVDKDQYVNLVKLNWELLVLLPSQRGGDTANDYRGSCLQLEFGLVCKSRADEVMMNLAKRKEKYRLSCFDWFLNKVLLLP